jgi:hypothetical protein
VTTEQSQTIIHERFEQPEDHHAIKHKLDAVSLVKCGSVAAVEDEITYLTEKYLDALPEAPSEWARGYMFKQIATEAASSALGNDIARHISMYCITNTFEEMMQEAKSYELKQKPCDTLKKSQPVIKSLQTDQESQTCSVKTLSTAIQTVPEVSSSSHSSSNGPTYSEFSSQSSSHDSPDSNISSHPVLIHTPSDSSQLSSHSSSSSTSSQSDPIPPYRPPHIRERQNRRYNSHSSSRSSHRGRYGFHKRDTAFSGYRDARDNWWTGTSRFAPFCPPELLQLCYMFRHMCNYSYM